METGVHASMSGSYRSPELDAYASGSYGKAAEQYREAYHHMFMTGDLLSGAIAKQQSLK